MGFFDAINRAFFNLTYNPEASKAYDEQSEKAAGAVEDIKKQIKSYRDARDSLLSSNKASDYFATNSLARITEWENWLEKNGSLASGDYTAKSTEMKAQWESVYNINPIVLQMQRIPGFIDLFLKDKDTKIPTAEKTELTKLKEAAQKFNDSITTKTPAEILAKRDDYNRQFGEIQKKIPENFEDLKEGFESEPQLTLLQGIDEQYFNDYKNRVEQKELADENTFKPTRVVSRTLDYFGQGMSVAWPWFFGVILAIIVANDMIGRAPLYRVFFFVWTILLSKFGFIPFFPYLLFFYYLYRSFTAINWGNVFTFEPTGPRMDYMKAPVLFAFLPLIQGKKDQSVPWYMRLVYYDANDYGGLPDKKRVAYEMAAADAVGKILDASMLGLDNVTFESMMCELKSAMLGIQKTNFQDVVQALKGLTV
jgi:hypothetical protein